MLGGVCDRTCDDRPGDAVFSDWKGDFADADPVWRIGHYRLHNGGVSHFKKTDHDPQPGRDSGQL